MFLNNKYTAAYMRLVETRRQRAKPTIAERHHIIPTSMGGSNNDENLVYFTPREHFLAHLLLTKMVHDRVHLRKVGRALAMMGMSSHSTPGRQPSRSYHRARVAFVISRGAISEQERKKRSDTFKLKHQDQAWSAKRTEGIRTAMASPEYRKKISVERRSRSSNIEYLAKLSAANIRRYGDPAERQKTSIAIKNVRGTPESKAKTSAASKKMWEGPEFRANQSLKRKERWDKWRASKNTE